MRIDSEEVGSDVVVAGRRTNKGEINCSREIRPTLNQSIPLISSKLRRCDNGGSLTILYVGRFSLFR